MNRLSVSDRARILACLVDGNSMRATSRITGAAKLTIERLLESAGRACQELHSARMVNLPCEQIQCDEIWGFVGCKEKTFTARAEGVDINLCALVLCGHMETLNTASEAARTLGRIGGSRNTAAQNAARARNAKKGGRPKIQKILEYPVKLNSD